MVISDQDGHLALVRGLCASFAPVRPVHPPVSAGSARFRLAPRAGRPGPGGCAFFPVCASARDPAAGSCSCPFAGQGLPWRAAGFARVLALFRGRFRAITLDPRFSRVARCVRLLGAPPAPVLSFARGACAFWRPARLRRVFFFGFVFVFVFFACVRRPGARRARFFSLGCFFWAGRAFLLGLAPCAARAAALFGRVRALGCFFRCAPGPRRPRLSRFFCASAAPRAPRAVLFFAAHFPRRFPSGLLLSPSCVPLVLLALPVPVVPPLGPSLSLASPGVSLRFRFWRPCSARRRVRAPGARRAFLGPPRPSRSFRFCSGALGSGAGAVRVFRAGAARAPARFGWLCPFQALPV